MKNFLLIILVTLFCSCGTDQGEGKTYVYTIKNTSSKPVKIKVIDTYSPDITPKIINLNVGEELTKTYKDNLPPSGYSYHQFFEGDKLVVVYDNKYLSFVFDGFDDGSSKNPFNTSVYYKTKEIFLFKDADFSDAIPCDGNCN